MSLQQRLELQLSIQQWIDNLIMNNHLRAADVEDALNKVLVNLKDQVMLEILIEQAQQQQQTSIEENLQEEQEGIED